MFGAISRVNMGYLVLDRATGAAVAGYELSNNTMSNTTNSMIQDASGNMYISGNNGHIVRISTSNTTDWAKVYNYNGQNFGYIHMCYYNGYIYGTGSQHGNGNYLYKMNPSDGTFVWFINISNSSTGFYGIYGISASADGIAVVGNGPGANGNEKTYLLNYPLDAGITGTYGDFTFTSASASASSISAAFTSVSTPSLSNSSVTSGTSSYSSSLSTASSVWNSKVSLS